MAEYHAVLSPSSAERWMTCAGSVVLSEGIEDKGSVYAAEGTAAHDVAAMCLAEGKDAAAFVGRVIDAKGTDITITQDIADDIQVYVDAVRQRIEAYRLSGGTVTLEVEQRVPIGHVTTEADAEGTSDAVLIVEFPDGSIVIEVWDLKFGKGQPVSAEQNKQGRLYAIGTVKKFSPVFDFKPETSVGIVIHQPRIERVPSEWGTTVGDLEAFGQEVKQAAHLVRAARHCRDGGSIEFQEKYLVAGPHCRKSFCKARGTCPAYRGDSLSVFNGGQPPNADDFENLVEEAGKGDDRITWLRLILAKAEQIEDLIAQSFAEANRWLHEQGNTAEAIEQLGHKLVEGKQGNREWADEDEAEKTLKTMRLKQDEMYEFKLISPTKAAALAPSYGKDGKPLPPKEGAPEPRIGDRQWKKLQGLITRKDPKPSVVPADHKKPPLVIKPAAEDFEDLTQEVVEDEGAGIC